MPRAGGQRRSLCVALALWTVRSGRFVGSVSYVTLRQMNPTGDQQPQPTRTPSTRPWGSVALAAGLVLAAVAIGLVVVQMRQQPVASVASPSIRVLPVTPPPSPSPTLAHLAPGKVTFDAKKYRVGSIVRFTAALNQAVRSNQLHVRALDRTKNVLGDKEVAGDMTTTDKLTSEFGTQYMIPGKYVLQVLADNVIVAQGTFTLVK